MQIKVTRVLLATSMAGLLAAAGPARSAAPDLGPVMSGQTLDSGKWYGRAGGLTGSDRVEAFRSGGRYPVFSGVVGQRVMVGWDEEVAKRTNMALAEEKPQAVAHPFRPPRQPQY
jgi:hypothetical protein